MDVERGETHLGGVNAHVDAGSVGFFPLNSLDVYDEFLSVYLYDLADLLAFVVAANNLRTSRFRTRVYDDRDLFSVDNNFSANFSAL